jgi:mRNA-degrading endonuclease toxin of MazEF toxin-antitoxin module
MTFTENYTPNTIHREEIVRGGLYLVDLGDVEGRDNSLFAKIRPCCCVSNSKCNKFSPVLTFVCLSSASSPEKLEKLRKMPTRVFVGKEETGMKDSTAACEQIISVPRSSIVRFIGKKLTDSTMDKINAAIRIQLEI